ncbi:MAG: SoxXA-binding protein [Gammaproteobacteria bacterium]|nr:SoxXA-binding protein [Gammaproteobacteria bacterium]
MMKRGVIAKSLLLWILSMVALPLFAGEKEQAVELLAAAQKAEKRAATVDGVWRDVGKYIANAEKALEAGDYKKSMELAQIAKEQSELGFQQMVSQQELKIPSYYK